MHEYMNEAPCFASLRYFARPEQLPGGAHTRTCIITLLHWKETGRKYIVPTKE